MKKYIMALSIALLFSSVYWFSKPLHKGKSKEQQINGKEQLPYKIIADEIAEEYKRISNEKYEQRYAELVNIYRDYEDNWNTYKKKLDEEKHWAKQLIGGNFNYAMTLDEIKQIIKDKFVAMKRKGLIISKDAYEKIKSSYINRPNTDLTRIWGAEWLKTGIELHKNKDYDVPGYKIVSCNQKSINVVLFFGNGRFPIASRLKKKEAFIDFVKIIGHPAGSKPHPLLLKLGYVDFGASQARDANIIQEISTGKYFVVDLEIKGFQHSEIGQRKLYEYPVQESFAYYAYQKFLLSNEDELEITIKINLEEE